MVAEKENVKLLWGIFESRGINPCRRHFTIGGHPDMMSTHQGLGRGSGKSGRSKGGCMNFILQISSKCGRGGQKIRKFCKLNILMPLGRMSVSCGAGGERHWPPQREARGRRGGR